MESLFVEAKKHTPEVRFDPSERIFVIKGRSYPENADKFYSPLKDWLENFEHQNPYTISFQFDYLSSSSVVAVLTMLRGIENKSKPGKEISVQWAFDSEDDDLKRTGEDLMKFINLDVDLKSIVNHD